MEEGSFLLDGPRTDYKIYKDVWEMEQGSSSSDSKPRKSSAHRSAWFSGAAETPSLGTRKQLLEAGTPGFGHKTLLGVMGDGSISKVLASQAQGPKFNPQNPH